MTEEAINNHLTLRQHEILKFIEKHHVSHSYAPSYREIQHHFGYNSVGTVYNLIRALKKKGFLSTGNGAHRSFEIPSSQRRENSDLELKIIGTLAAGEPIHFYPQPQTISVPRAMVPSPDKTYVLRAEGELLKSEAVSEGDLLVVEAREDPEDGETIIVLLEGKRAWIKRFSLVEGGGLLSSYSEKETPLTFSPHQFHVIGIVLGLLRLY